MNYILLDTNIYLHCRMFDTLPWQTIIGSNDSFVVLMPMQVLREIEKKKDGNQPQIKKRAKDVSSKLGELLLDDKESQVHVETCEQPQKKDFKDGFSIEIADDVILMSAIWHTRNCPNDLIVVSRDIPFLAKAKQAGLRFVKMPEEYVLPSEAVEDKEKQQLLAELNKLKNRMPKPRLAFKDGKNIIRLKRVTEREPVVDPKLSDKERELALYEEMEKISKERFVSISIYAFNDGTAPTGEFTVKFDSSKLADCKLDHDIETVELPIEPDYVDETLEEWERIPSYRSFCIYGKKDTEPESDFEREYDPLTHGMNCWVKDYGLDLTEATSGSIDWILFDPALPDPVKGTLNVVIEE